MHILIILVNFGSVGLTSKPCKPLLENVYPQGFVTGYQNIDSQIELVTIYEQRIGYVSTYNGQLINIYVIDVINQTDSSSLGGISRLHNPNILLTIMLLQFLVMLIKLSKFIRKDVGIGHKVIMLLAVFLLHSNHIKAKPIFSSDFVTLGKMIDFLVLVEAFIKIAFATRRAPKNVPLMRLGRCKTCSLQHRSNEFVIKSEHFVQEFAVLNVVSLLVTVKLHRVCNHLLIGNVLED